MRWHFVVLWPQKSMAVLWMTECHTHSFNAGSVEMDVSEENGHSPHSIHSHRLMNRTGTFCIWSLLSFSRWCLFFPCLLARHVSRRHPLCCWVAPSLEVLKLGSSVLQAACSWLFVIFPVFGFFFFLLFLSEWLWPVSKGYAPIPITAISQPETSVQQVEFCGCCIPSCSAQNGERCRHAASARTVAFSLLPVAASQCEEHHCCSWRHWWRRELQIPQPWSPAHSHATATRWRRLCCQRK